MEKIDLASAVQKPIATFCRSRVGDKPHVFLTLSPALTQVPWKTRAVKEFVRGLVHESLLASDPAAPIQIKLRKRSTLKDLNAFLDINPSYWVQLRVAGRGLRLLDTTVEELFADIGYRCEEWFGVEDSAARLRIFGPMEAASQNIVFALDLSRRFLRADLLLPVFEDGSPYPVFSSTPRTQRA